MGAGLTDQNFGDIDFVFNDSGTPGERHLYAHKGILARTCEYFKASTFLALGLPLIVVFSREWSAKDCHEPHAPMDLNSNGVSSIVAEKDLKDGDDQDLSTAIQSDEDLLTAAPSDKTEHNVNNRVDNHARQRLFIQVDDFSYETMHNLLYFLYTGRVNLHFHAVKIQSNHGYPAKADPLELYCAADFYGLQNLKDRCFRFLEDTRTADNICGRLFSISCRPYKELQEKYINFLLEHYEEIKKKEDWRAVFRDQDEEIAREEWRYRGELLLEITKRLVFSK